MADYQERSDWQNQEINKWAVDNKGRGTLHWTTGTGKGFIGCEVARKFLDKHPNGKVRIDVPLIERKEDWEKRVKNQVPQYAHCIEISVIDTTIKQIKEENINILEFKSEEKTLQIIDEIHLMYGNTEFSALEYLNAKFVLALTATPKDLQGRHKKLENFAPIVSYISEEEAIEKGFISPSIQFNLGIELPEGKRKIYDELSDIIGNSLSKFSDSFDLAIKCLSGDKQSNESALLFAYKVAHSNGWLDSYRTSSNPEEQEINSLWNPNVVIGYAKTLMLAVRKRNKFLDDSVEKINLAISIIDDERFKDKKSMIFSQSTQFADAFTQTYNKAYLEKQNVLIASNDVICNLNYNEPCVAYHSKLSPRLFPSPTTGKIIKFGPDRIRKRAKERIMSGASRIIATAEALNVGFDDESMSLLIVCGRNSNSSTHNQRTGRGKRIDINDVNKKAIIVNLYFKDTADERRLKKSQEQSIKKNIHWIDDISQIGTNFTKPDITI